MSIGSKHDVDSAGSATATAHPKRNSAFTPVAAEDMSLEQARVLGGVTWHSHAVAPLEARERPTFTMSAQRGDVLTIGTLDYSGGVHVQTEPLTTYQVNIPLNGRLHTASGDERMVATPRKAVAYRRHRVAVMEGWHSRLVVLALRIDGAALEDRLAELLGEPTETPIDLHPSVDLTSRWGRDWAGLVQILWQSLQSSGGESMFQQPEIITGMQDSILTGLLFAANHSRRADLLGGQSTSQSALDASIAYIEGHASEPLAVAEIARVAGISVRSLQATFRDKLEMSPIEYLRDVRLDRAREELTNARSASLSVKEVAQRWGMGHAGRFAIAYARRFGESPMDTLRRF